MKTLKIPTQLFREGTATLEGDAIRLSISSDAPYLRYNWADDSEYFEVLDHSHGGVDLSRLASGAALLFNHNRNIQLGTINSPVLEGGRCYVQARISDAADVSSYKTRVQEGILKDTSIGYEITDAGTCVGERDGKPVYKFKFAIHEASLVTIPADPTVGLGRCRSEEPKCGLKEIGIDIMQASCNKQPMTKELETETEIANPVIPPAVEVPETVAETPAVETPAEAPAVEAPAVETPEVVDTEAVRAAAIKGERERAVSIQTWARDISKLRNIDLHEASEKHIEEGKQLAEFKEWVLENEFKAKPANFNTDQTAGAQKMKRDAFMQLSTAEQSTYCRNGGKITD